MNKIILPILLVAVLLTGCMQIRFGNAINFVRGSGVAASESRPVKDFDKVKVNGIGDLEITQGESEALVIEADDNILPLITSEVKDNTLVIGLKETYTIDPDVKIRYHLSVKTLVGVVFNGAGNATCSALNTDRLALEINGAGKYNFANLQAKDVVVEISGAGSVTGSGSSENLSINASGAGDAQFGELQANSASVSISGLGRVEVWATENLSINISGAGQVSYYGHPQISQNITGGGSIKSLGDK